MKQVKNIIFDAGDVLLSYRWKYMLMDYGLTEEEAVRIERKCLMIRKDCGDCLILGQFHSRRSLNVIVKNIQRMKK